MRVRAAIAALAALLAVGVPQAGSEAPGPLLLGQAPDTSLTELIGAVGGRGATETPGRYGYLRKLDGHLQAVAASRLAAGNEARATATAGRHGVTVSPQGELSVDVYVEGDVHRAARELGALGMRVGAVSDRAPVHIVEGFLPAEALPQAAALDVTRAILPTLSLNRTGTLTSQGDAAVRGPQARAFGVNGAGVLVGVISDSINQVAPRVAGSVASGDLPANTQVLSDYAGGTDEGRAMAEIIYDEAPGIGGILFHTANGGPAAKAAAIDDLVSRGARVIADDTSYPGEPFFQDGIITQAVDRAKAAGTGYFISAGNDGRHAWEGTYTGGADEDFDPGAPVEPIQTVGHLNPNNEITVVLQWDEPWGHATTDLALDIYSSGTVTAGVSNTNNAMTGLPMEYAFIHGGSGGGDYGIGIRNPTGAGTPFMRFMAFTNGAGTVAFDFPTSSGAIDADAASAKGALTIAATRYNTPTVPETFSSNGPVTRRFDLNGTRLATPEVRQKPELAAPDGVQTTVTGFSNFLGTSAAAPAAAGIAALIISSNPSITVDALYAVMTNPVNALDCTPPGQPDSDCGVGFLLADRAVDQARDKTPPVITPTISPPAPDGADGWYRGPVSVSWGVSDTETPVAPQGCDPVAPGDGLSSFTCTASSIGGTTSVPLSLKRDSTPPSQPVITGIGATTYPVATLPKASSITCASADPTSGVVGCVITGYASTGGPHKLKATATNGAGLTSATTVSYAVERLPAISRLTLAKGLTLAKLARSGVPFTLRVQAGSTRLVVKLVARLPKASGSGTAPVTLGSLTKQVSAGTIQVRITLTAKAKRQLAALSKATVKITVRGTSANTKDASLVRSVVVRA